VRSASRSAQPLGGGAMGASCTAPPAPGCGECSMGGPALPKTRLRVGSASCLLDAPIQLALARGDYKNLAVNLNWVQCPPDAGAMSSMLSAGLIDMALMYTEDAIAFIAQGNALRICGTFASTPRVWGAHVCSGSKERSLSDFRGTILGLPDEYGANVAVSMLGELPGWGTLLELPRKLFSSVRRASEALLRGYVQVLVWETLPAKQYVQSGDWDSLGNMFLPWPSLLLVSSRESLYSKEGAIKNFISWARQVCRDFQADPCNPEALEYLRARNLSEQEALAFIAKTSYSCECEVDEEALLRPLEHLQRTRSIAADRPMGPAKFLAKEICHLTGSYGPAVVEPGQFTPAKQGKQPPLDDEDFDFPAELTMASCQREVSIISDSDGSVPSVGSSPDEADAIPLPAAAAAAAPGGRVVQPPVPAPTPTATTSSSSAAAAALTTSSSSAVAAGVSSAVRRERWPVPAG